MGQPGRICFIPDRHGYSVPGQHGSQLIPVDCSLQLAFVQVPGPESAAELRTRLVILQRPAECSKGSSLIPQPFPAFCQLQAGLNIILYPAHSAFQKLLIIPGGLLMPAMVTQLIGIIILIARSELFSSFRPFLIDPQIAVGICFIFFMRNTDVTAKRRPVYLQILMHRPDPFKMAAAADEPVAAQRSCHIPGRIKTQIILHVYAVYPLRQIAF
ncbi:hypothetical protein D3C76_1266720 [compost metagenome]